MFDIYADLKKRGEACGRDEGLVGEWGVGGMGVGVQ